MTAVIRIHPTASQPKVVAELEQATGLRAVVRDSKSFLEPRTCRDLARTILSRFDRDPTPPSAA